MTGAYTPHEVADLVLEHLRSRGPQSVRSVADDLDLTWRTVKDGIHVLMVRGEIEHAELGSIPLKYRARKSS